MRNRLRSVHLKNFQVHKDFKMDFTVGLNTLLGHNNQGKSCVFRAIQWVLTNEPAGEWMRRIAGDEMKTAHVKLVFEDGTVIERVRGKNENKYILDGQEFSGFNRAVPDPIVEHIGKTKIKFGNTELCPIIHEVGGALFMVDDTGPIKGSVLNYLTGIDIADKIKKDVSKEIRTIRDNLVFATHSLEDGREELKKCKGLKELCKMYEKVSAKQLEIGVLKSTVEQAEEMIAEHRLVAKKATAYGEFVRDVGPRCKSGLHTIAVLDAYKSLSETIAALARVKHVTVIGSRVDALKGLLVKAEEMRKRIEQAESLLSNLAITSKHIRNDVKLREQAEKELEKCKVCPTCGQVVKNG